LCRDVEIRASDASHAKNLDDLSGYDYDCDFGCDFGCDCDCDHVGNVIDQYHYVFLCGELKILMTMCDRMGTNSDHPRRMCDDRKIVIVVVVAVVVVLVLVIVVVAVVVDGKVDMDTIEQGMNSVSSSMERVAVVEAKVMCWTTVCVDQLSAAEALDLLERKKKLSQFRLMVTVSILSSTRIQLVKPLAVAVVVVVVVVVVVAVVVVVVVAVVVVVPIWI